MLVMVFIGAITGEFILHTEPDWLSFEGSIISGILSGLLTLAGVLLSLQFSQDIEEKRQKEKEDDIKIEKEVEQRIRRNYMRIIITELNWNNLLLNTVIKSSDWGLIQLIATKQWEMNSSKITWIDDETFSELANVYNNLLAIKFNIQRLSGIPLEEWIETSTKKRIQEINSIIDKLDKLM